MGSTIEPGLQLILLFCLAVTAGIAFGAITMIIQLRRWNAAILSLAVVVGFLLIGGAGIFSRMNPIYHNSMIIGALLAFLIFVPIVAIGSYVGLRVFLLNHYSDLFADSDEETTQVIITQSPASANNQAFPATSSQMPQVPMAASAAGTSRNARPRLREDQQSQPTIDRNSTLDRRKTRPPFRRPRQL